MWRILAGCALIALGACSPKIPDSAAGVGFDNAVMNPVPAAPETRTAALPPARAVSQETTATLAATAPVATPAPAPTPLPPVATTPVAVPATQPSTASSQYVQASPSNPAPAVVGNPGISDENDFTAVGSRRSIEDDADLLARNRAQYASVAPTTVPKRIETGPNIVAYALSTKHAVGTKVHSRFNINSKVRYQKNCAKYLSPDHAQMAFLEKGGPRKDRAGLDPDGDGYACNWDPTPYRLVNGG